MIDENTITAHDFRVNNWRSECEFKINEAPLSQDCKTRMFNFINLINDDHSFMCIFHLQTNLRDTEAILFLDPKHIKALHASHNAQISFGFVNDFLHIHFKEPPQEDFTLFVNNKLSFNLVRLLDNHMKLAIQLDSNLQRVI